MKKTHYVVVAVMALLFGFVGGTLSTKLLQPGPKTPQDDPDLNRVIVAAEIHLVDGQAKDRWILRLSKDGEPDMTFINKEGWAPMALGLNRIGLPFCNMILEPHKSGGPSFSLLDTEMKNRAVLGLREDGDPYLSLLDPDGQVRAALGCMEFKNPLTGLREKRSPSSLLLFGEDGKIIFAAPDLKVLTAKTSGHWGDSLEE